MSDITLRLVKGSPLTNQEVDDNFANLNTDKYQAGDSASFQDVTLDNMTGPITWNTDEGALDIPLNAQVTLQAGQEFVFYAKATEAIANGDVVMFAGAQGGHLLIAKCDMGAAGFDPSHIVGIATQSFAINDFGYVTSKGKVRDIDTSGFTEGAILYVDPTTAGGYTSTKPAPPNHIVQIAAVTRSHATQGTVLTRVSHMPDTDEVPEGSTNLYFTDARAVSAIKADGDWNATNWGTAYGWGDHSTQSYATQTYVNNAVSNLVDSAPATLDTLNELAAALGDDPNFAATVTNSIGTKWTQDNTKISNWDTAYSWGNHASAGYLKYTTSSGSPGESAYLLSIGKSTDHQYIQSHSSQPLRLNPAGNAVQIGTGNYAIFHDAYHPNADKWTTARTLSLTGDVTGSVSWDGSANASITATVANDSHTHDGRYYTEAESDSRFVNVTGDTMTGDLSFGAQVGTWISSNAMNDAIGWNSSYGTYIGSNVGGTHYLRGNGTFSTTGGTYKLFHDAYHPNADKWTTTRTNTVTLSGDVTGSGSASVDGTGNWTVSIPAVVANDSHSHSNYMLRGNGAQTGINNQLESSAYRFDPSTDNPTNEHYAVLTYGNQANVVGQLATHFVNGATYNRAYNSSWSAWARMFDDDYHPNADKWTTARTNTVTLTGDASGSGSASVDGTGNWTVSIPVVVNNDSHTHDGRYVNVTGDTMTGNLNFTADDVGIAYTGHSGVYMEGKRALWSHNNGHVTLSAAGGDLYLGYNSGAEYVTGLITLHADTYNSTKAIKIIDHDTGRLWSEGSRTFADNYHPNADKWTTARTNTVTLTGDASGSGSASVDGTGNWTVSVPVVVNNDSHTHDGRYVNATGDTMTGDLTLSSCSIKLPNSSGDGIRSSDNYRVIDSLNDTIRIGDTAKHNIIRLHGNGSDDFRVYYSSTDHNIWHAGNDGSGSGLDADLLDGKHLAQIARYQSSSDFPNGTLVTTDIPSSASSGSSFVIEITGKAYGSSRPHSVIAEGYLYNNTIINTAGTNLSGSNFTYLKVMNNGGYLSFWWPSHGYWNSYDVHVRDSSGGTQNYNRVTSIVNSVDPSGATKKIQINLATSWTSSNDGSGSGLDADLLDGQQGSYYAPASHNHSGVYLPISGKAADSELLDGVDITRIVHGNGVNRTDGGDPNTLRPSGFYENYQGNSPTSTWYNYINMRHTNAGNGHGHQIAGSFYSAGDIYNRSYSGSGTFTGWARLWNTANDGSGSGLDADLLDGQHASAFLGVSAKAADSNLLDGIDLHTGRNNEANKVVRTDGTGYAQFGWINTTSGVTTGTNRIYASNDGYIRYVTNDTFRNNLGLWWSGNDGSGSGLDADLLDGQHGSYYASASSIGNGTLTVATAGSASGGGTFTANQSGNTTITITGATIPTSLPANGGNADTVDNLHAASFLRSDADDSFSGALTSTARNNGIFGTYDSTKTDHIWSMGTSFKNHSAGTNFGNLYGLAYKHTNNTTGGTMGGGHQMVWCNNGSPRAAMGYDRFWHAASGNLWGSSNDGSGSGLDADLLDGQQGSYYATAASVNAIAALDPTLTLTGDVTGSATFTNLGNATLTTTVADNSHSHSNYMPIRWSTPYTVPTTTTWGSYNLGNGTMMQAGGTGRPPGSTHGYWFVGGRRDAAGGYAGLYFDNYNGGQGLFIGGNTVDTSVPNWTRVWTANTDGSGSGLDADLLDGQHGSYYAPASHNHALTLSGDVSGSGSVSGTISVTVNNDSHSHSNYLPYGTGGNVDVNSLLGTVLFTGSTGGWSNRGPFVNNAGALLSLNTHPGSYYSQLWFDTAGSNFYHRTANNVTPTAAWRKVWDAGNDGSGSGLDADLLDGQHASAFASASHSHSYLPLTGGTITGGLTSSGYNTVSFYAASFAALLVNSKTVKAVEDYAAGAVGSYCWAMEMGNNATARNLGDTRAGSGLRPASVLMSNSPAVSTTIINRAGIYAPGSDDNAVLAGTWRLMSAYADSYTYNDYPMALWLRIS